MDRLLYSFDLLTHFSVIDVKKKIDTIKQLTIEVESNGNKYSLVLVKPWPPLNRSLRRLNEISELSEDEIDSVEVFIRDNNTFIEIKKKNDEGIISVPCKDIKD